MCIHHFSHFNHGLSQIRGGKRKKVFFNLTVAPPIAFNKWRKARRQRQTTLVHPFLYLHNVAYCASAPRRIPFAAHGLNFPSVHRHQENVQLSAACRPEEDNLSDFLSAFIKWWFCSVLPRIPKHFYPNSRTNRGQINTYIQSI